MRKLFLGLARAIVAVSLGLMAMKAVILWQEPTPFSEGFRAYWNQAMLLMWAELGLAFVAILFAKFSRD